jgi:hypothetical protein
MLNAAEYLKPFPGLGKDGSEILKKHTARDFVAQNACAVDRILRR